MLKTAFGTPRGMEMGNNSANVLAVVCVTAFIVVIAAVVMWFVTLSGLKRDDRESGMAEVRMFRALERRYATVGEAVAEGKKAFGSFFSAGMPYDSVRAPAEHMPVSAMREVSNALDAAEKAMAEDIKIGVTNAELAQKANACGEIDVAFFSACESYDAVALALNSRLSSFVGRMVSKGKGYQRREIFSISH